MKRMNFWEPSRGTALALCAAAGMTGCAEKPPGCVDKPTIDTATEMLRKHIRQDLAQNPSLNLDDDPEGVLAGYLNGIKIAITGVVSNGYDESAKKLSCKGTLEVTLPDGEAYRRETVYSTQLTVDNAQTFLLEVEDFTPLVKQFSQNTLSYYLNHRWSGDWTGPYECSGLAGAADGAQGSYSQPVTMHVVGNKATLERTTRSGGHETLTGIVGTMSGSISLSGRGQNSPDDMWLTYFDGRVAGKTYRATGSIDLPGRVTLRHCTLNLTQGVAAAESNPQPQAPTQVQSAPVSPSPAPVPPADSLNGHYEGQGNGGNVTIDIGAVAADGTYPTTISTFAESAGGETCGGGLRGEGRLDGKVLRVVGPAPTLSDVTCTVTLNIDAKGFLHSDEGAGCSTFHGAACGFDADLARPH